MQKILGVLFLYFFTNRTQRCNTFLIWRKSVCSGGSDFCRFFCEILSDKRIGLTEESFLWTPNWHSPFVIFSPVLQIRYNFSPNGLGKILRVVSCNSIIVHVLNKFVSLDNWVLVLPHEV